MRTKLSSKQVVNLTNDEFRKCYSLNMRDRGSMQYKLSDCKQMRHRYSIADTFRLQDESGKLLAWALVFSYHKAIRPTAYFYVRKADRRKGYGSRLRMAIHKKYGRVFVAPWDYQSKMFFAQWK